MDKSIKLRKINVIYNSFLAQYPLLSEAIKVKNLLEENGVPAKVKRKTLFFKYFYKEAIFKKTYRVFVDEIELSKAEEIYEAYLKDSLNEINSYYLDDLEEEELVDILLNPHLWIDFDMKYAKNILIERKKITKEIEISIENKLEELTDKEYRNFILMIVMIYANLAILVVAPEFSIVGVVLGIQLLLGKLQIRDENIERVKKLYLPFHGIVLIIASIASTIKEFYDIFS